MDLPDYQPGLGQWASQMLARYDQYLLTPKPEVAELRAAGVSQAKIEILFPLDLEDYRGRIMRLLSQQATLDMVRDEFTNAQAENALWGGVPAPLRPGFNSPQDATRDTEAKNPGFAAERLMTTIGALSALRGWPFHEHAAALGFNGRTFAEDKMRRLGANFDAVNASMERLLRILAAASASV